MKLTFSCHYNQLRQKKPNSVLPNRNKTVEFWHILGKKKVNWIDVPSKAEIKIAKTNKKVVCLGPIPNCIFYRLKIKRYSKYFIELIW